MDVLADVLMSYLKRIGTTMAKMVEASGRSSSHVNVFDAIQAIQSCTSPAVNQIHPAQQSQQGQEQQQQPSPPPFAGSTGASHKWQELAAFCFGPNWIQEASGVVRRDSSTGGKAGPSSSKKTGWVAPFREEVPAFPQSSDRCANPHRMTPSVGLSLHMSADSVMHKDEMQSKQLDEIPDSLFEAEWGSASEPNQKKRKASEQETPTNKKAKLEGGDGKDLPRSSSNHSIVTKDNDNNSKLRPTFVPNFLPSYPESSRMGRSVVDVDAANDSKRGEDDYILGVRSSLVDLGQHQYWGTGWDSDKKDDQAPAVPMGRLAAGNSGGSAVVVPLGRASGSRVSRILEGSMDAVH